VLNFALVNQFLHRSRYVFDGHVRINTVLIEQIDDISLEALERGLSHLLDMVWPTVQPSLFAVSSNWKPNFVAITTCEVDPIGWTKNRPFLDGAAG
jgi:hypothetical protein